MNWYIPITIIPGVGLIIISTSNILLDLNREISVLEANKTIKKIVSAKLQQLKITSWSIVFQYIGILFFLLSGITEFIISEDNFSIYLLLSGVICVSISIIFMIIYSIKAIKIRQKHLKIQEK